MSTWIVGIASSVAATVISFTLGYLSRQRTALVSRIVGRGPFVVFSPHRETLIVCGSHAIAGDVNRIIRAGDVMATLQVSLAALRYSGLGKVRMATVEEVETATIATKDVVLVGGPYVNSLTNATLRALDAQHKALVSFDAYTVIVNDYEPSTPILNGNQIVTDFGIIYTFPNPADPKYRLTIVAGCLRIGTLAAARTLASREFMRSIRKVGRSAHHCALIRADAAERDIAASRIVHSVTRIYQDAH
jgi:hypothetical protein